MKTASLRPTEESKNVEFDNLKPQDRRQTRRQARFDSRVGELEGTPCGARSGWSSSIFATPKTRC